MEKPLLSVIMSTLNTKEEFLKQSIESILNQTYSNFEFIIVVDGGKDDEIINKYYNDSRIKIVKHDEPKGLPISLNEAINMSNGEYIARMDSDDISLPNRFNDQIEYMENNKNIDITSMYYKEFFDSNRVIKEKFIKKEEVKCKLFFVNIIAHPCVMFRKKSVLEKNLYYDEKYTYSQDFELWNRYDNVNIEIIPKIGLNYRIHSKQISTQKKEKQNSFYYSILKRNLKRLNISEIYFEDVLALNGRCKCKNPKRIYEFINLALDSNKKQKVYSQYEFEKVLKRQYLIFCLKNRCFFNYQFFKNIKYLI